MTAISPSPLARKVVTNANVAQGPNGQTSLQLGTLPAGADYYWHVSAGANGVFSTAFKFTIGPAIVISAPVPVTPLNGSTTTGWPAFTVNDAARTGPAQPVSAQPPQPGALAKSRRDSESR